MPNSETYDVSLTSTGFDPQRHEELLALAEGALPSAR
jgi:hypothetical protein